jgi:hypothetical protein
MVFHALAGQITPLDSRELRRLPRCQVFREFDVVDPGASEAFAGFAYALRQNPPRLMPSASGTLARTPGPGSQTFPDGPAAATLISADKGQIAVTRVTVLRCIFNVLAVTALP